MRVLLTGGNGFIGYHLIKVILKSTDYSLGLLLRTSSNLWRIKDLLLGNRIEVFMLDKVKLSEIFARFMPDIVIHLAAYYKRLPTSEEAEQIMNSNIIFPSQILEVMSQTGVSLFINTGTFTEYLQDKERLVLNRENARPRDLYSASKTAFEEILKFYSLKYDISSLTLVLMTPYGEADNENKVIPYIIKSSLESVEADLTLGEQSLDFIYAEDVAFAYLKSIEFLLRTKTGYNSFQIGSGEAHTIRQIADMIKDINRSLTVNWGKKAYLKDDIFFSKADITKAKNMLQWSPKTSIQDGLNRTYLYYQDKYGKKRS